MLIANGDGTYLGGPADMICILQLPAGTFHVAFFEESPMPGPVQPISELEFIRLKSKMHHTTGAATLEGAQAHAAELRTTIKLPDENVMVDEAIAVTDPVSVWIVPNWTRGNIGLKKALFNQK